MVEMSVETTKAGKGLKMEAKELNNY